jgi:hypothetical protein
MEDKMKKIVIFGNSRFPIVRVMCIMFLLLFCVMGHLIGEELGDVNNDGQITIVDALRIAQFYVGLETEFFAAPPADVDLDGVINIIDALLVAQYYVGIINELPGAAKCLPCEELPPLPGSTPGSTIVTIPAGTPAPTIEPRGGLFTITTSKQVARVCETFTTTVYLNTGTSEVGSYQVTISYDYPVIQLRDCPSLSPFLEGFSFWYDSYIDVDHSTPGTLIIEGSRYKSYAIGPGTRLKLFSIKWKALPFETTGFNDYVVSHITMTVDSIRVDMGEPFDEPGVDQRYSDIIIYTGNVVLPSSW